MDTETHSYTQKISVAKIYNIMSPIYSIIIIMMLIIIIRRRRMLLEFDILIYLKEGDIV